MDGSQDGILFVDSCVEYYWYRCEYKSLTRETGIQGV